MNKRSRSTEAAKLAKRDPVRVRNYLKEVLSLDPTSSASQMIARRFEFCGIRTVGTEANVDREKISQRRKQVDASLREIRSKFWEWPARKVRQMLDGLNVKDLPELKAGVNRLKLLTLYREDMQELRSHSKCEINLYNSFRRIMMSSPRKAGQIKERYLREVAESGRRKEVVAMIRMLRSDYPNLYKVEADWFNQITKVKARKSQSAEYTGVNFDLPGWVIYLGIYVIFRLILSLFRAF